MCAILPSPPLSRMLGSKSRKRKVGVFTIIYPSVCRVLPKAMKLSTWLLISSLCICELARVEHLLGALMCSLLESFAVNNLGKSKLHELRLDLLLFVVCLLLNQNWIYLDLQLVNASVSNFPEHFSPDFSISLKKILDISFKTSPCRYSK